MPVVSGAISEVAVYRGQALVTRTRTINVELAAGASEASRTKHQSSFL
ncbi:MAG: hypothetical protein GWP14_09155 [Actinobacteria bacterium]|nr:hypothetical protein [Actinomycetota bacterium]